MLDKVVIQFDYFRGCCPVFSTSFIEEVGLTSLWTSLAFSCQETHYLSFNSERVCVLSCYVQPVFVVTMLLLAPSSTVWLLFLLQSAPMVGEVGSGTSVGFLVWGTGSFAVVGRAESFPSDSRTTSGSVVWAVYELSTTWSSMSADGWDCVPILLVDLYEVFSTGAYRQLGGARS